MRYVFVQKGESFEVRGIDIGIVDTRRVQIIAGLAVGEAVALMRPLEYSGEIPIAKPSAPLKARTKRRTDP